MWLSKENIEGIVNNPSSGLTDDEKNKLELGRYSLERRPNDKFFIVFH